MKGGIFEALEGRFAGDFEAAARHGWAVLPRNSGVFGLGEGAARRFSARRTAPSARGEKIFKKFFKRGVENRKIGVWEMPEAVWAHLIWGARGDFWV